MVVSKITRIGQLGAKTESVSGQAETIAAEDAQILAYDPVMDLVPEQFERNPVVKHMSRFPSEPGARLMNLNFRAELMAPKSGSKGTAVPLSPVIKACGFSEVLTGGTSNVYVPISGSFPTCTMKEFIDGVAKTLAGAAGNIKFQFKVGEPVFIEVDMQGKYSAIADVALLTPSYPAQVPFLFMGATVEIFGDILTLDNLEIDMQQEIVISPLPSDQSGIDFAKIVGRKPIMTFDPELVAVATHDAYAKLLSKSTAIVTIRINDSNGNMVEMSLPAVRYMGLTKGDRDGISILNATCELCKNSDAGNDEINMTFGTSSSSSSSSSSQSSSSSSSSSD